MSVQTSLAGTHALVTAGPTWVAIDRVRVLTSVFTGETGLQVARSLADLGCRVTLLMGPGRCRLLDGDWERLCIERFFYFEELERLLRSHLGGRSYDVIVHSAAVADYKPEQYTAGKIPSGIDGLSIKLLPTPKLVHVIRAESQSSFLVTFKLEVGQSEQNLLRIAKESLHRYGADVVVANNLDEMTERTHAAFIIDSAGSIMRVDTKAELARHLAGLIADRVEGRKDSSPTG